MNLCKNDSKGIDICLGLEIAGVYSGAAWVCLGCSVVSEGASRHRLMGEFWPVNLLVVVNFTSDAKVCELEEVAGVALGASKESKNVVWLNVSVDDVFGMDVLKSLGHFVGDEFRQGFVLILGDATENALKVSFGSEVHDHASSVDFGEDDSVSELNDMLVTF